jgi:hypothetical protein
MTVAVGLIAVYRWTANAYGVYAGLGVVGTVLVVMTVSFATAATIKGIAGGQSDQMAALRCRDNGHNF